jgi:beta-fructofuranosidase
MDGDPHRPFYHYVNPEHRLNDPNGLCFWQGRWHLFYQAYPPEDSRQHWGHAVSEDLVHWRDLPLAIYPNPEDKCFSGTCYVDGEDRVIAAYHGIATGTMVAVSSDPLLLNWKKVTGNAVIPLAKPGDDPLPFNIFDPCIWKQGDYYYIITAGQDLTGPGGKAVRAEFLHRSKDLAKWEYLHPFLEGDHFSLVGDDGACPYFWPIGEGENQRHIMLHFSHMSGGKWMLGDYDTKRQKFVITDGGDFNHGNVNPGGTHAPSAYPDGKGGVICIFNMNPGAPTEGWNQIMSLPRRLTLDEHGMLNIEPAGDIESLRGKHQRVEERNLPNGEEIVFDNIKGNAMELIAEIDPAGAKVIELDVLRSPNEEEVTRILLHPKAGFRMRTGLRKQTKSVFNHRTITIDTSRSTTWDAVQARPPEVAQVRIGNEKTVQLRVFVDKSIVEVFIDGRQCSAVRVYPGRDDSLGVSLRATGGDAKLSSLDAWQMENIWE